MNDSKDRPLRVAVVGVGHLGTYHARIYGANEGAELVAVVDANEERAGALAEELGVAALSSIDDLPDDLDAISIAVPTAFHAEVAVPLLERGLPCLVEKPLAATLEQADAILAAAERGGTRVAVGHVERFQPGLRRVLEMKMKPRFLEVHRLAPFSFRSMDIGVVHDLMIHDLDLILELMDGTDVAEVDVAGGAILTEREDMASVRLVFEDGARANVTASRVSLETMRRFRLFSSDRYVSLDFHKNYGLIVEKGEDWEQGREKLQGLDPADLASHPGLFEGDMMRVAELDLGEEERPLQAELASFLDSVRGDVEPEVTGADGRRALALADRIAEAIEAQRW